MDLVGKEEDGETKREDDDSGEWGRKMVMGSERSESRKNRNEEKEVKTVWAG